MANQHLSRSLRIYQKASIIFVLLASLLLLAVLYLSVSRATIHVTPIAQPVAQEVEVVIVPNAEQEGEVTGYVVRDRFTQGQSFDLDGTEESGEPVPAQATGVVTLTNETESDQPLVATTRLLSEEGVLFRLLDAVTVPANGEVTAAVYADQEGESGNIGPTSFTIPGLLATKQETIYATSTAAMKGGLQYVRVVTEADLTKAQGELETSITEEAISQFRSALPSAEFDGESVIIDSVAVEFSAEPGDEVGVFTGNVTYQVTAVFYSQELISDYVEAALIAEIGEGVDIHAVDTSDLSATIEEINVDQERAVLSVSLSGTTILASNNDLFSTDRFTGKSERDVIALLESEPAVQSVEVSFTPFWLKRMPTLRDHIEIKIKSKKVEEIPENE